MIRDESEVWVYLDANLTEVAAFVNLPVEISFKSRRYVVHIDISQRGIQVHRVHLQYLTENKIPQSDGQFREEDLTWILLLKLVVRELFWLAGLLIILFRLT